MGTMYNHCSMVLVVWQSEILIKWVYVILSQWNPHFIHYIRFKKTFKEVVRVKSTSFL